MKKKITVITGQHSLSGLHKTRSERSFISSNQSIQHRRKKKKKMKTMRVHAPRESFKAFKNHSSIREVKTNLSNQSHINFTKGSKSLRGKRKEQKFNVNTTEKENKELFRKNLEKRISPWEQNQSGQKSKIRKKKSKLQRKNNTFRTIWQASSLTRTSRQSESHVIKASEHHDQNSKKKESRSIITRSQVTRFQKGKTNNSSMGVSKYNNSNIKNMGLQTPAICTGHISKTTDTSQKTKKKKKVHQRAIHDIILHRKEGTRGGNTFHLQRINTEGINEIKLH